MTANALWHFRRRAGPNAEQALLFWVVSSPSVSGLRDGGRPDVDSGVNRGEGCSMPTHNPRKIRVVIVDDHLEIRTLLTDVVTSSDDMVVVGQAADGPQAYDLIRATGPDVVLMDIRMPGMSGVEVTRRLTSEGCRSRVLLHTSELRPSVVRDAADAGASGYLVKSGKASAILPAIRVVDSGGTVWPAAS